MISPDPDFQRGEGRARPDDSDGTPDAVVPRFYRRNPGTDLPTRRSEGAYALSSFHHPVKSTRASQKKMSAMIVNAGRKRRMTGRTSRI